MSASSPSALRNAAAHAAPRDLQLARDAAGFAELHNCTSSTSFTAAAAQVVAARVDAATGELHQLGAPVSAGGEGTCHVSVAPGGAHVLAANYMGGSVCAIARRPDGSLDASSVQLGSLPSRAHPISSRC